MLHRVVAWFGLRLCGCPIPPFEVVEGLLDVAIRKHGDNVGLPPLLLASPTFQ